MSVPHSFVRFSNLVEKEGVIEPECGEVSERSKEPDSKSGVGQLTVGSNPTFSAYTPAPRGEVSELAEGVRLEIVCAPKEHRGFESHPLRNTFCHLL